MYIEFELPGRSVLTPGTFVACGAFHKKQEFILLRVSPASTHQLHPLD